MILIEILLTVMLFLIKEKRFVGGAFTSSCTRTHSKQKEKNTQNHFIECHFLCIYLFTLPKLIEHILDFIFVFMMINCDN